MLPLAEAPENATDPVEVVFGTTSVIFTILGVRKEYLGAFCGENKHHRSNSPSTDATGQNL